MTEGFKAVEEALKGKKMLGKTVANVDGVRAYRTAKGIRYQAQVRVAGRKAISKSFETREDAKAWRKIELARKPDVIVEQAGPGGMTMPELFAAYIAQRDASPNPLPAGQRMQFARLSAHPVLANLLVSDMDVAKAREYCTARVTGQYSAKVHSSTVMSEFVRISIALQRVGARRNWAQKVNNVLIPFNPLVGAMDILREDGLVSDSNRRKRRPNVDELNRVLDYFRGEQYAKRNCAKLPMGDIVALATINAFRRGEIVRMQWSKLKDGIIALDRKDSDSEGGRRDTLVPVLDMAMEIIARQPRVEGEDRIFPFAADTIGQHWQEACDALGIKDLRFHDLRHEAISTIALVLGQTEAMQISGHKTPKAFMIYVQHDEDAKAISKKASAAIKLKTASLVAV